jgi:hypothetical protein
MLFIFQDEGLLRLMVNQQACVSNAPLLTPYIHGCLSCIATTCSFSNVRRRNAALNKTVSLSYIFRDITPCSRLENQQSFSGEHKTSTFRTAACYLLHSGFLIGLFLDPEDGGDTFLQKVSRFSTICKSLYLRRCKSS